MCYNPNMLKYPYVEDYYLIIAGYIDPKTGKTTSTFWFNPLISLARYDISFVSNVSEEINAGRALTVRQSELAVRLLDKYQRQLQSHGLDVTDIVREPKFKFGLREVDRTASIDFDGEHILVRFPYNSAMIEQIRELASNSQGRIEWNRDDKVWKSAATEHNLMKLTNWAESHSIPVSDSVKELVDLVNDAMSQNPLAKLVKTDVAYEIVDAEKSLTEYVDQRSGNSDDWLASLCDLSGVLGYTISRPVEKVVHERWGEWIVPFFTKKDILLPGIEDITVEDLSSIFEYCDIAKRNTIVIYEPDLSNRLLGMARQIVNDVETVTNSNNIDWSKRVIHLLKPACPPSGTIPLLITTSSMVFGATKQLMIQQAEKVVYFTAGVYNKSSRKLNG